MDLKICSLLAMVVITRFLSGCSCDEIKNDTSSKNVTKDPWSENCKIGNCSANPECVYEDPAGCIHISSEKESMQYTINMLNTSSIICLEILSEYATVPDGTLKVNLSESDPDGIQTQTTDVFDKARGFKFISKYPKVQISIELGQNTNWSSILIKYSEIKFEMHDTIEMSDSGRLSSKLFGDSWFRPNTARIYHLAPSLGSWNSSSVSITVSSLDMEEKYTGRYLLIGAGNQTFNGPPAAHISGSIKKPQQYQVASDFAYLVFFTASSDQRFDFNIEWIRTGERIKKPDEDKQDKNVPDSMLQAVPVCFYNSSFIAEFNKTHDAVDMFSKFQVKFAEIANKYVKEKNLKHIQEIRAESIQLMQISTILPPDDDKEDLENGALYTIISIVQPYNSKMSVFRFHELQEILTKFDIYDENTEHSLFGFKVGKCPRNTDYRSWYYATVLVAIVSAVMFLTIWLCSLNTTWRSRQYRNTTKKFLRKLPGLPTKRRKKQTANEYTVYDNHGFAPPKISVASDLQGMSVIKKMCDQKVVDKKYKSVHSDEDSDEEIFTRNWIMKKNPSLTEDLQTDTAYDAEAMRLRRLHMFNVPLHNEEPSQPKRLWQPMKIEDNFGTNTATNQYTFNKLFDDDETFDGNPSNTKL